MEMDIELEDLAMGKLPNKMKKEKVSDATLKEIKTLNNLVTKWEKRSVADYKKLSLTDRKALMFALEELNDACYSAKGLIREAKSKKEQKEDRGKYGMVDNY